MLNHKSYHSFLVLFVAPLFFAALFAPETSHAETCTNPIGPIIDLSNAKSTTGQGYHAKIRRAYNQASTGADINMPDGYQPFDWDGDGENDVLPKMLWLIRVMEIPRATEPPERILVPLPQPRYSRPGYRVD